MLFSIMLLVIASFIALSPAVLGTAQELQDLDTRSKIADQMLSSMMLSADPCDNFFQYACGGWVTNMTLPADRNYYSRSFTGIADRVSDILHDIVKSAADIPDDRVGILWSSCMDEDAIESLGMNPYFDEIEKIASISDLDELFAHIGIMEKKQTSYLFDIEVDIDSANTSRYIVSSYQYGLTMPRYRYVSPEANRTADLFEHFKRLHSLSGLQLSQSDIDVDSAIYNIVSLEIQIAQFTKPYDKLRDPLATFNLRSVQNCSDETGLDFLTYLQNMGLESLTKSSYITIDNPEFLTKMGQLLRSTPLPVLKDAVMLWTLIKMSDFLPRKIRDEHFRFFSKTLRGIKEQPPRYKTCIGYVDQFLGDDLGQRFLSNINFTEKEKQSVISIVESIMGQYEESFRNVPWMDRPTRQLAIAKLHKIKSLIGYPTTWTDYGSLKLEVGKFADNILQARQYLLSQLFTVILPNPVDPYRFLMTVPTVNAYYDQTRNSINFPAAILELPFFTSEQSVPLAFNYGGIGTVIGHELGHAFDDQGRKYDGDGILKPWWPQEVADRFKERATCLGNQYAAIEFPEGLRINPELTMGENIADNAGLSVAFKAFLTIKGSNPDDELIPGITDRKLFWIAFAQNWCSLQTIENLRNLLATNPHSPSKARVNVPLMNDEEFSRDFQCPVGSNMNPIQRCIFW